MLQENQEKLLSYYLNGAMDKTVEARIRHVEKRAHNTYSVSFSNSVILLKSMSAKLEKY